MSSRETTCDGETSDESGALNITIKRLARDLPSTSLGPGRLYLYKVS